jgi:hypothetical protein
MTKRHGAVRCRSPRARNVGTISTKLFTHFPEDATAACAVDAAITWSHRHERSLLPQHSTVKTGRVHHTPQWSQSRRAPHASPALRRHVRSSWVSLSVLRLLRWCAGCPAGGGCGSTHVESRAHAGALGTAHLARTDSRKWSPTCSTHSGTPSVGTVLCRTVSGHWLGCAAPCHQWALCCATPSVGTVH